MSIMWKYLDKRNAAIQAIEDYENMRFIIENTDSQIVDTKDRMVCFGSQKLDGMPHGYNPQSTEERIVNSLSKIDILKERYRQAKEYMNWFKPAWDSLNDDDQYVLAAFYMSGESDVGAICKHFGIERSSAYNKKNRALVKLSTCLYGKE